MLARSAYAHRDSAVPNDARARLRQIIEEKSVKRGKFVLASGAQSDYLFDMKKTMLDPEGINLLADAVLDKIFETDAQFVGGLAMGAVPVVVAAVLKSFERVRPLQGFWVRKEQKEHGTRNLADGYIVDNSEVVIVDDVTTSGCSVMKAVNEARSHGCTVNFVVTIVDRLEGAREELGKHGIKLVPLFERSDFNI